MKRREEMGKGSEERKELTQAHPLLHDHIYNQSWDRLVKGIPFGDIRVIDYAVKYVVTDHLQ